MASVSLLKFVDKYVGTILVGCLQFFKSNKQITKHDKSILVVRIWTLGESLLVLPMIKKLKEQGFKVSVLVSDRSKLVFERQPFIDEVIHFENKKKLFTIFKKYDVVIDTEPYENISALLSWYLGKKTIGYKGLFRDRLYTYPVIYDDKIHTSAMIARLMSPLNINYVPKELLPINCTKEEAKKVDSLFLNIDIKNKKIIGMHTGTAESAPWRSWKKERFAALIDELIKKDYIVLLTGTKSEIENNNSIINMLKNKTIAKNKVYNVAGKTTLFELAYLLTKCSVFISNDTGPMHLSAAMGTKTIGLFGPNLPVRFGPLGKNNISIYKGSDLKCSPCIDVHKGKFGNCKDNGKCMDLITVKDVYDATISLIKNK